MRSRPLRRNPPIDVSSLHEVSNADIQNAIRAYRPITRIPHAERLRKARAVLTKNGYAVGNQIGKGTTATVYELAAYPKYVVKLTYDPTDAFLMAEMRGMSRTGVPLPKGIPEVATVAALDDGLYAVVMERLEPLNRKQLFKRLYNIGYAMLWGSTFSTDSALWKQWKNQPDSPEYAFLNAARIVHDLGFIPYDLAPANIMQRPATGEIVVNDFGYSSPKRKVRGSDVARLKNPHHARAPHPHFAPRPRHLMPTRRNPVIDLSEFDESLGQGGVTSNLRREMGLVLSANRGLTRARDVLARNGFALGNKLGEGTAATVYEMANDPRWVMKITADVTDVSVLADAQFLLRDRDGNLPPGIPEVAGAYDLGEGLYGVMIERLYPLSDKEFDGVNREMLSLNYGWAANDLADRYIGLDPRDPLRSVLSAILTVRDRGFRMSDIGGNNVLKRENGTFVVSDFGYAGVELPKRRYSRDLLLLQNPRSKERQFEGAPRVTRALRAHRMESGDGSVVARFFPPTWEAVQSAVLAYTVTDAEFGTATENVFVKYGFEHRKKAYLAFRRDALKFTDPLVLFRAVNVPSLPSIRMDGVGVYWTYDPRFARDYIQGARDPQPDDLKILVAVVRPEDVNWPATVALNIWTDTEKEIRLKPRTPVKIIAIYDGDGELVSARERDARANPRPSPLPTRRSR